MTRARDIILALADPAAVLELDGRASATNRAFDARGVDLTTFARLEPGESHETLGPDGALTRWSLTKLRGGARLLIGRDAPAGLGGNEHYLASLSHELRTPLNGVLGMAGLLAGTRLSAEQRAYLAALQDSGAHLIGLVNDVLDLARMDAGRLTLHPAPIEVVRLLQSTAELLSPRAHAKGLEIAWTAPARLPRVLADEGRVRQILFNLAGNAVKFTQTGGVLLDVDARGGIDDRVRLRFSVTDTGPGIAIDQRERIFEAFFQADPAHSSRGDSSGLGLAIVRRLAAAHDGVIGLDNPPEGGARFWFEAEFAVAEAAPKPPLLLGRRVMIASPSPIVRTAARGLIEAAGGAAMACEDLDAAQLRAAAVDVVLVDHALVRDAKIGRTVKLKPVATVPSVILLAPEERGRIGRYRAAGFGGYLIKPLREASLVERILLVLGEVQVHADTDTADERAQLTAGSGARVLVAEDNPINALLTRSLLEREGCVVDRVSNGFEALSAASSWIYDLILMDLRMPGLDGRATTEALRARGCRTPIVALTANAFEEDRRACLAAGMDDFLSKPLDQAVLRAALRQWTAVGWTRPQTQVKLAG